MQIEDHRSVQYLTTAQKAARLRVSKSWLDHDRLKPTPTVPFVRIGRMVRYRDEAIEQLVAA